MGIKIRVRHGSIRNIPPLILTDLNLQRRRFRRRTASMYPLWASLLKNSLVLRRGVKASGILSENILQHSNTRVISEVTMVHRHYHTRNDTTSDKTEFVSLHHAICCRQQFRLQFSTVAFNYILQALDAASHLRCDITKRKVWWVWTISHAGQIAWK
jgi:hypothetical protein